MLRMATKAPWFIPNHQLHAELKIHSIKDFISKNATKFYSKFNLIPQNEEFNLDAEYPTHIRIKRIVPKHFFYPS